MATILCDISALKFIRNARAENQELDLIFDHSSLQADHLIPQSQRSKLELFADSGGCIHILTNSYSDRYSQQDVITHRVNLKDLPSSSFYRVDENIYVTAVPLSILHMYRYTDLITQMAIAMEFCGSYTYMLANDELVSKCSPMSNPDKLKNFVKACSGFYGIKRMQRCCRYIQSLSASPMETKLFLYFCLPGTLGGFNLPKALLNAEVEVNSEIDNRRHYQILHPDLLWEQQNKKIAVEYDSDSYHLNTKAHYVDIARKNLLSSQGIDVITLTTKDVRNVTKLNGIARQIRKSLGLRIDRNYNANTYFNLYRKLFIRSSLE